MAGVAAACGVAAAWGWVQSVGWVCALLSVVVVVVVVVAYVAGLTYIRSSGGGDVVTGQPPCLEGCKALMCRARLGSHMCKYKITTPTCTHSFTHQAVCYPPGSTLPTRQYIAS